MTDDLPRLDAAPLAPPPGAFEAVARRARLRRNRRLSMVVAVVVIVGLAGSSLAGRGSSDEDITTAGDPEAVPTTTAGVRSTSTTAADVTTTEVLDVPAATAPSVAGGSTTSTSTIEGEVIDVCCPDGAPPEEPQRVHAGRVVDSAGAPLSGIYVYLYRCMCGPDAETLTGLDGRFEVPCGNQPLLLWGVGPNLWSGETTPDQNWAPVVFGDATTFGPPPCTEPGLAVEDIVMVPGVTVTGLWLDDDGNPRPNMTGQFTKGVGNNIVRVDMRSTDATGRYWLFGLPTGSLVASNMHLYQTPFEAESGDVVYIDWGPQDDGGNGPIIPGTPP